MVMTHDARLAAKLPALASSWVVHTPPWCRCKDNSCVHGRVTEVGWTSEDDVLRKLGFSQQDYAVRHQLRMMGVAGVIVHRLQPEHHFHEYGPQWRSKDFKLMMEAAEAANLLKGASE